MRTKRYVQPKDERRRNGAVVAIKPDLAAWRAALKEAEGDISRCRPQPDGTVLVVNKSRSRSTTSPFRGDRP